MGLIDTVLVVPVVAPFAVAQPTEAVRLALAPPLGQRFAVTGAKR